MNAIAPAHARVGASRRAHSGTSTSQAARRSAAVSLSAIAAFLGLTGALHVVTPEMDPSWRFLSEYSIGPKGWLMMLAFFAWALSCVALSLALREHLATRVGQAGRAVLLVVGLALVGAGLFAQDPITATPDELTTHGTLHAVASMIGIPGIPIAALLITWSLGRHNRAWRSRRRLLTVLAVFTWLSLIAMGVYLAIAVPRAGGFGPEVHAGWMNRLVVLTYCAWQIAVSYGAYRIHARPGADDGPKIPHSSAT